MNNHAQISRRHSSCSPRNWPNPSFSYGAFHINCCCDKWKFCNRKRKKIWNSFHRFSHLYSLLSWSVNQSPTSASTTRSFTHTHTYSLVSMSELRAFYKTKSLMFHVCNRSCKWSFGILALDDCFSNVVTHSSLPVQTSDLHVVWLYLHQPQWSALNW